MKNATILKKIVSLERCITRAREEYAKDFTHFDTNYTVQDAVLMNIVRACEQAFDIAQITIRQNKLPRPDTNKQLFSVLAKAAIITEKTKASLEGIVGFRNICIHEYEKINLDVVRSVVTNDLDHLLNYTSEIISHYDTRA